LLPCLRAASTGSTPSSPAAAVQGVVVSMSGGVVVSWRCSTQQERGQRRRVLAGWRVASARPRRAWSRRERHAGAFCARVLRRGYGGYGDAVGARRGRRAWWHRWAPGPVVAMKEKRGSSTWPAWWRHGHVVVSLGLLLGLLCIIKGEREPGDQVEGFRAG
jgi:hypothetical protein